MTGFARNDIVRHKRSGNTYLVLGRCTIEATLADCYMYRGTDGRTWVRPASEMEDGRFDRLCDSAAAAVGAPVSDDGVVVPRSELERTIKVLRYAAHPHPSPHADALEKLINSEQRS